MVAVVEEAPVRMALPWLAIACRAGADLPMLAQELADEAEGGVITPAMARAIVADRHCPLPLLRETLANATAAAIRVHERAQAAAGVSAENPSPLEGEGGRRRRSDEGCQRCARNARR